MWWEPAGGGSGRGSEQGIELDDLIKRYITRRKKKKKKTKVQVMPSSEFYQSLIGRSGMLVAVMSLYIVLSGVWRWYVRI